MLRIDISSVRVAGLPPRRAASRLRSTPRQTRHWRELAREIPETFPRGGKEIARFRDRVRSALRECRRRKSKATREFSRGTRSPILLRFDVPFTLASSRQPRSIRLIPYRPRIELAARVVDPSSAFIGIGRAPNRALTRECASASPLSSALAPGTPVRRGVSPPDRSEIADRRSPPSIARSRWRITGSNPPRGFRGKIDFPEDAGTKNLPGIQSSPLDARIPIPTTGGGGGWWSYRVSGATRTCDSCVRTSGARGETGMIIPVDALAHCHCCGRERERRTRGEEE